MRRLFLILSVALLFTGFTSCVDEDVADMEDQLIQQATDNGDEEDGVDDEP